MKPLHSFYSNPGSAPILVSLSLSLRPNTFRLSLSEWNNSVGDASRFLYAEGFTRLQKQRLPESKGLASPTQTTDSSTCEGRFRFCSCVYPAGTLHEQPPLTEKYCFTPNLPKTLSLVGSALAKAEGAIAVLRVSSSPTQFNQTIAPIINSRWRTR